MFTSRSLSFVAASLLLASTVRAQTPKTPSKPGKPGTSLEIDATLWSPIAASVANADIVAMGRTYHPGAVLVSDKGTMPIARALDGWGKDMIAAKKTGQKATVEFKFSKRQDDATTAFEQGMFKYVTTVDGKSTASYRHLEALLVKVGTKWKTLMERQLDAGTEAEWNAIK